MVKITNVAFSEKGALKPTIRQGFASALDLGVEFRGSAVDMVAVDNGVYQGVLAEDANGTPIYVKVSYTISGKAYTKPAAKPAKADAEAIEFAE